MSVSISYILWRYFLNTKIGLKETKMITSEIRNERKKFKRRKETERIVDRRDIKPQINRRKKDESRKQMRRKE
jgi:hypothetical protein